MDLDLITNVCVSLYVVCVFPPFSEVLSQPLLRPGCCSLTPCPAQFLVLVALELAKIGLASSTDFVVGIVKSICTCVQFEMS